jgi:hypothetical protein
VLKPETLLLAMVTVLSASACGQTLMMKNTISGGDSTGESFPANAISCELRTSLYAWGS